ncbi:hypothetical protein BJ878DRAFT_482444 [Calycina marina]|uniref:Uncharacterized protein n=1 Tax=Calycina marina TaxID=1763456 RepID=A0A9P8CCU4_9HELO|nr:hypothetical protein BJ878DRAFT_482444 [Calycina marina]
MHGPYLPVDEKKDLISKFLGTEDVLNLDADHVFEAQLIGYYLDWLEKTAETKYSLTDIDAIFLASHKRIQNYKSNQGLAAKKLRAAKIDYQKNDFGGSLLAHVMNELGIADNSDRMALLEKGINLRKGVVWAIKDSAPGTIASSSSGTSPTTHPGTTPNTQSGKSPDQQSSSCDEYQPLDTKPPPETTVTQPKAGSGDIMHGELNTPYSYKMEYDFDIEFVKFMQDRIVSVEENMQNNLNTIMKTVKISTGNDQLKDFKMDFATTLKTCNSLVNFRKPTQKTKTTTARRLVAANPPAPANKAASKAGSGSTPSGSKGTKCQVRSNFQTNPSGVTPSTKSTTQGQHAKESSGQTPVGTSPKS